MKNSLNSAYKEEKIEDLKEFDQPIEYRRSHSTLWRKLNPIMVSFIILRRVII